MRSLDANEVSTAAELLNMMYSQNVVDILKIIQFSEDQVNVKKIAKLTGQDQSSVSYYIAKMKRHGLIYKNGRLGYPRVNVTRIHNIINTINKFK